MSDAVAAPKKVTKKAPFETYCVAPRVRAMIEKTGTNAINSRATQRTAELKKEREPDVEREIALKSGKKVVKDAAGKVVKNADGKVQEAELTPADRTAYENARKAFSARRAEIDADITLQKSAKYRLGGDFAALLAAETDDAATELLKFAFGVCKLKDKKIVMPAFFNGEGAENLDWYQLFSRTATWEKLVKTGDYEVAEENFSFKGTIGFCIQKLAKDMIAPLVTDSQGSVIMEQKEKKRKDKDGNETTEFVLSAKRDATGPYASMRISKKALKFLDDLFVDVYGILAAQLLLRVEGKTITKSDLTAVVQSVLDMGLPIKQTIEYGTKEVVDPAAKKANSELPADKRKKESELPKIKVKSADILSTVEGSRYAKIQERLRAWQAAYDAHMSDKSAAAKKAAADKAAAKELAAKEGKK